MMFFIPLIPEPQRRGKIVKICGFSSLAKTEKQELAEANLQAALMKHAPEEPLTGPVKVEVTLFFPLPKAMSKKKMTENPIHVKKPDIDNCIKHLFDCMTRCGFWIDDSQVYSLNVQKTYYDKPGWLVKITEGNNAKS